MCVFVCVCVCVCMRQDCVKVMAMRYLAPCFYNKVIGVLFPVALCTLS